MRTIVFIALSVFWCATTWGQTGAKKMNAEDAILAENEAFAKVWSAGDAKAAAGFYTEDGVRVCAMGDIQHGRAEIAQAYDKLLHGPFAGAKVSIERGSVRPLTSELALWQGEMQIEPGGGKPPI